MARRELPKDTSRESVDLRIDDDVHFRAIKTSQEGRAIKADRRRICYQRTIAHQDYFPAILQKKIDPLSHCLGPEAPRFLMVQFALCAIKRILSADPPSHANSPEPR